MRFGPRNGSRARDGARRIYRAMETGIATNLIVFSRGLDVGPDGSDITLSKASRSRVEAALVHIGTHADLFQACSTSARRGRVVFSGGLGERGGEHATDPGAVP